MDAKTRVFVRTRWCFYVFTACFEEKQVSDWRFFEDATDSWILPNLPNDKQEKLPLSWSTVSQNVGRVIFCNCLNPLNWKESVWNCWTPRSFSRSSGLRCWTPSLKSWECNSPEERRIISWTTHRQTYSWSSFCAGSGCVFFDISCKTGIWRTMTIRTIWTFLLPGSQIRSAFPVFYHTCRAVKVTGRKRENVITKGIVTIKNHTIQLYWCEAVASSRKCYLPSKNRIGNTVYWNEDICDFHSFPERNHAYRLTYTKRRPQWFVRIRKLTELSRNLVNGSKME